jgi:hypothetical protein
MVSNTSSDAAHTLSYLYFSPSRNFMPLIESAEFQLDAKIGVAAFESFFF